MCGRYALGAAHIDFLDGLQEQYARLFPGRRGDDGRVRGGGPQRLRGGGPGGDDNSEASTSQKSASKERPTFPVAASVGITWEREQDFWPSYNIAPRQRAPVARRSSDGEVMLETMQWGLIPHWTKFPPTGPLNTINARSEALIDASSGGMWHALKGHKRCVVPAQGYYEWQKKGGTKVAHFTRLPLENGESAASPPLLFFAGLWDTVKYEVPVPSKFVPEEGDDREPYPTGNPVPLSTFTILTTTPAPDIAWLHDRMPCVLTDEDEIARWLDLGEVRGWQEGKGGTADVLHSFKGLASYPVVPEVGKIGRSEPNYILPVAERKDGIKSFFQKAAVKAESKGGKEMASPKKDLNSDTGKPEQDDLKHTEEKPEVKEEEKPKVEVEEPAVKDEKPETQDDKPNVESKPAPDPTSTPTKPAHDAKTISDSPSQPPTTPKRKREGGRQTRVVRPKEEPKGQPSITTFFKSPHK